MDTNSSTWENDEIKVDVLYSAAGVGTSILVTSKFTGKYMLIDVGDGALRDILARVGTEFVEELDVVAITHGHFDHSGGLFSLLGFIRMLKRTTPLDIVFPEGSAEVDGLIDVFKECYRPSILFQLRCQEVKHGVEFDTDFFKVMAYRAKHYGMENVSDEEVLMPAVGYRVRIGTTLIAYTGDTRMCDEIRELVKDVDLAIIEATHEQRPEDEPEVHLTIDEAKELGTLAKDFILIHQIPKFDDVHVEV